MHDEDDGACALLVNPVSWYIHSKLPGRQSMYRAVSVPNASQVPYQTCRMVPHIVLADGPKKPRHVGIVPK